MDVCSIVLADDHVMFRQGVKRIIEETPGLEVVGEANDGLELLNLLKARIPELVLLDISMPHLRGLEAIREIKKLYPRVKVIFLTMHRSREFLHQALEAGADGFLLKEDADFELLRAIQTVRGEKNSSQPSCPPRWRIWPCGTRSADPNPLYPPGKDHRQAPGRRQDSQGNCGAPVYQHLHGAPAPGQHHAETQPEETGRPHQVRPQPGHHYRPPLILYENSREASLRAKAGVPGATEGPGLPA